MTKTTEPEGWPSYVRLAYEQSAVDAGIAEQKELERRYPPKRVLDVTERPFPSISAQKRAA